MSYKIYSNPRTEKYLQKYVSVHALFLDNKQIRLYHMPDHISSAFKILNERPIISIEYRRVVERKTAQKIESTKRVQCLASVYMCHVT